MCLELSESSKQTAIAVANHLNVAYKNTKTVAKQIIAKEKLNDKQAEKENSETIPFTIVINDIKYLGVTLTKPLFGMTRLSIL